MAVFSSPEDIFKQLELQEMASEDRARNIHRLFDEGDKETLMAVRALMNMVAGNPSSRALAAYYEGFVSAKIESRFNICPVHGVNHEEEEFSSHNEGSTTTRDNDEVVEVVVDIPVEDLMNTYRLEWRDGNLHCKDCGIQYQSLEDRMVKEPDDCHGCQLRSAHG